MRFGMTISLGLILIPTGVIAKPPETDKMRQIAKLPRLNIYSTFLQFELDQGLLAPPKKVSKEDQIRELNKALQGDATDAERYYRLGGLYDDLPDEARAKEAYAKAVELYRERVQAEPENFVLLANFGTALLAAEKEREGEAALRQAIHRAPQEWECWAALGDSLVGKAYEKIQDAGKNQAKLRKPQMSRMKLFRRNSSEQDFAQARDWLDEAGACFDRAVAVSSQEPRAYLRRASYYFSRASAEIIEERRKPHSLKEQLSHLAADLKKAGELNPQDHLAIACAAFWEVCSSLAETTGTLRADTKWNSKGMSFDWRIFFAKKSDILNDLPEPTRQTVNWAIKRLEQLEQSGDSAVAAGAAEGLAFLQMEIVVDYGAAAKSFQRVISHDPQNETAWDLLTICWSMANHPDECITACNERLKRKDSAHNHFMLAKAYERTSQLEHAEEQIRAALKSDPDDFLANLSLAVLLLKRDDDPNVLAEAGRFLNKARSALSKDSFPQEKSDYSSTGGLYLALTGNMEEAKQQFQQALRFDPTNEEASLAMQALGE